MQEIWKDIAGYKGMYQVSNKGNVRSLSWNKTGIIRNMYLKKHKNGYLQVELAKDGVKKMYLVHRLVAESFIPNPSSLPIINHKDENKKNNNVENLEWCTFSYNSRYSIRNNPRRRTKGVMNIPVIQINVATKQETKHDSIYELCKERKWRTSSIKDCCEGKRKTAYGFSWQYAN